jgi:hypothetical protein
MTAERALWIVRAIPYRSLALAAALVLAYRSGRGEDTAPGPVALVGKTGQGYRFAAVANGDTVKRIGTSVDASRSNGGRCHWALSVGGSPRGAQVVDRVHDRPRPLALPVDRHLRERADRRASGRRGADRDDRGHARDPRGGADICGSGKVAFRVHE